MQTKRNTFGGGLGFGLTLGLILILLLLSFGAYTDKKVNDVYRNFCDKIGSIDTIRNMSNSQVDAWGECLVQSQIYSTRYKTSFVSAFIFFWLVIISLKIDFMKKN